jgi:hypothetical protein
MARVGYLVHPVPGRARRIHRPGFETDGECGAEPAEGPATPGVAGSGRVRSDEQVSHSSHSSKGIDDAQFSLCT